MKKVYLFIAALCCAMTVCAADGALPGVFTINAYGDKVQFSSGNLQYRCGYGTWRFAKHQYDYVGGLQEGQERNFQEEYYCYNEGIYEANYSGLIDLFGWGTGNNPTRHEFDFNYYQTFIDWGVNTITNGGSHNWRTLTAKEWNYIYEMRPNAANLRSYAKVNGVKGLILMPDDWQPTASLNMTWDASTYAINIISDAQWNNWEEAGAVFLPAAGEQILRNNVAYVQHANEEGCYHTSSAPSDAEQFYSVRFPRNYSAQIGYYREWRGNRNAVRLVTPYDDGVSRYSVTVMQPEHGTISWEEDDINLDAVRSGATLHFHCADTDEGYELDSWVGGCDENGVLTVTADAVITCRIRKQYGWASEKELSGKFSVNAEGKQVVFSQGNLMYRPQSYTWQFTQNQYDIMGEYNASISSSYSGWIDLFGWGTSGYSSHYPYMTTTDNSQYGDGTKDIAGTYYDWGVCQKILNGGMEEGLWRTLTFDEWMYIIDQRPNASLYRGQAAVAEVEGFVLLPDDWTQPYGVSFSNTEKNTYDAYQWGQMEDAGAVFLPCGGMRKETTIWHPNAVGIYWTASQDTDDASKARSVYIYGQYIMENSNERSNGLSVRLVRDAESSEGIEEVSGNSGAADVRKAVIDGKVYILRNGKTYTVQGQRTMNNE